MLPMAQKYHETIYISNYISRCTETSRHYTFSQKSRPTNKENHEPISLLPHIANTLEIMPYKLIAEYLQCRFLNYLSEFRKKPNTRDISNP